MTSAAINPNRKHEPVNLLKRDSIRITTDRVAITEYIFRRKNLVLSRILLVQRLPL